MNPRTHYGVTSEVVNMRLIEDHHDLLCSRLFNSMMRDVKVFMQRNFTPTFRDLIVEIT